MLTIIIAIAFLLIVVHFAALLWLAAELRGKGTKPSDWVAESQMLHLVDTTKTTRKNKWRQ
ncbi:MAG: hypothetical protein WDN08_05455 [Rhizomicrobium sp.]